MRLALLLVALAAMPLSAQHALSSGGSYDPAVPAPSSVLGYQIGERFTPHHLLMRYLDRLAATSARVRLDTVAHTGTRSTSGSPIRPPRSTSMP